MLKYSLAVPVETFDIHCVKVIPQTFILHFISFTPNLKVAKISHMSGRPEQIYWYVFTIHDTPLGKRINIYIICLALIMEKYFHIEVNTNGWSRRITNYKTHCSALGITCIRQQASSLFSMIQKIIWHTFAFHLGVPITKCQPYYCLKANILQYRTKNLSIKNEGTELNVFKKFSNPNIVAP